MQTYRRFVSYVYQYENGKKAGNRGFIKVEARGNTCSMQIALKGICKDGNGHCKVYGFKREDGLLKGSLLAECPVKTGIVQEQLVFLRNEMGRAGYGLSELSGVIFQGDDESMYGTQWDDEPMKIENFQPDEENNRRRREEAVLAEEIRQEEPQEEPSAAGDADAEEAQKEAQNGQQEIAEGMPMQPEEDTAEAQRAQEAEPEAQREIIELREGQEEAKEPEKPEELEEAEEPENPEDPETVGAEQNEGAEEKAEEMPQKELEAAERPQELREAKEPEVSEDFDKLEEAAEIVEVEEEKENAVSPKVQAPGGAHTGQQAQTQTPEPMSIGQQREEPILESPMPMSTEPQEKNQMPIFTPPQAESQMPAFTEPPAENQNQAVVFAEPQREADMPFFAGSETENKGEPVENQVRENAATNPPESKEEVFQEEPLETLDTTIPISELKRKHAAPHYIKSDIEAENVQERNRAEGNRFCPFTDGVLQNCQKIALEDIRFLDPRDQGIRNNRFVQHGYQMFGHLLLAKVARNSQYIIGVPGMYQQQEKFMADMFGFHNFKYARRSGSRPACFGYWYRLIYPPKLGSGNVDSD